MNPLWRLLRQCYAAELRRHDAFVRSIKADQSLSKKSRKRCLWGARRQRNLARARLRFAELAAVYCVPVPHNLAKPIALAKHYDASARVAAASGDTASATNWSRRCRAQLREVAAAWWAWNCHSAKIAQNENAPEMVSEACQRTEPKMQQVDHEYTYEIRHEQPGDLAT